MYFWFEKKDYKKENGEVISLDGKFLDGYNNYLVETYRSKKQDVTWANNWRVDGKREFESHELMDEVFNKWCKESEN